MAKHGIAESTKLYGCMNVSFVADEDIDNGSIVAISDLAEGYTDVYKAKQPTKEDSVFIVIHPMYGYEDVRESEKNEDNYTNEAGKIFRTYELKPNRKFKVSSDMIKLEGGSTPLAKGQYVVPSGDSYLLTAVTDKPTDSAFVGIIETIEDSGFPYFGSSKGVKVDGMGYTFDTRVTKVKIRVISNSAGVSKN